MKTLLGRAWELEEDEGGPVLLGFLPAPRKRYSRGKITRKLRNLYLEGKSYTQ